MYTKLNELLSAPFHSILLSQTVKGAEVDFTKVMVKPFLSKNETLYQLTYTKGKQVTHENMGFDDMLNKVGDLLENIFVQCQIYSAEHDYHITHFKNYKLRTQPATKKVETAAHNRKKQYVITEDEGADFLIELGVINKDGTISKAKYDKFRQINRYLEFIADLKDEFPKDRPVRVVDFGCGKSYLTFALYYYITQKFGLSAIVHGLDLKKDVVEHCEALARRLGYDGLTFACGDIKEYSSDLAPDMVISLHACDTATDESFFKGIGWGSKIILAVPCCQHELNPQLKGEQNKAMLRYGIVRERLATLITDTSRALLLEAVGYKTDMAEFIDMEHTPKNVLIRCIKKGKGNKDALNEYYALKEQYGNFSQTLENRLKDNGYIK